MIHQDTIYTSRTGQVITSVSGSISVLSSFLILYIILRSRNGLTSAYHQIMFSVGFWDIIYSLAMALTTAPMPSDGMTKDIYNFAGKSVGNTATCDAQGFLFLLGGSFSIASCCSLYMYFSATIRFGMKEQTVKKRLLPFCFILSCFVSIPPPIYFLHKGIINPTPFATFCSTTTFPFNCINSDGPFEDDDIELREECIRGDQDTMMVASYYVMCGLGLAGLFVIGNMGLIFHCVLTNTLAMERSQQLTKNRNTDTLTSATGRVSSEGLHMDIDLGNEIDRQHNDNNNQDATDSKLCREMAMHSIGKKGEEQLDKLLSLQNVILLQAFMYISAFLLSYTIPIINLILELCQRDHWGNSGKAIVQLVLQPLQGFFNALIFIYQKAYDFKQATGADWLDAFIAVFKTPKEIPEIHFSNVSQVAIDQRFNSIGSDANFGNLAIDGTRMSANANGVSPSKRIRGKGMNFDAQCVSWNDVSSDNLNGANSAAASRLSRFNSPSLGGLSGFSFSQQSWSQSNVHVEGISLGPSPSSESGASDEDEH